jgi:hypothetical protein
MSYPWPILTFSWPLLISSAVLAVLGVRIYLTFADAVKREWVRSGKLTYDRLGNGGWTGLIAPYAIIFVVIFVGYQLIYPTYSCHVRMTIEVDWRGETKVGSSVIQLRAYYFPTWFGLIDASAGFDAFGEAVFVDLGDGVNLVALPGLGEGIWSIVANTYFESPKSVRSLELVFEKLKDESGKPMPLNPASKKAFPLFARFRKLDDPHSIQAVDPTDLAASYGPDVKLLRASVEITNEPLTSGIIEARLPWLENVLADYRKNPASPRYSVYYQNGTLDQGRIFVNDFVRR